MDDIEQNAIIVNALQRHATVVVQKSLVEGVDGTDGLRLPDTRDFDALAQRLEMLLADHLMGERLGRSGHERVRDKYLGDRHLIQYVDLFGHLIGR